MRIDANNSAPTALAQARSLGRDAAAGFAQALGSAAGKRNQDATTAAQQLVASTLVLPMLAQMRQDPFKSDLFHGGFAEDAFGAQFDTILADRIVQKADFGIVNQIRDRILGKAGVVGREVNVHA